jgi:hypothetical protein
MQLLVTTMMLLLLIRLSGGLVVFWGTYFLCVTMTK